MASPSTRTFSYGELEHITSGFSEDKKIGEGGFGEVFKGTIPDLGHVAIKKVKQEIKGDALMQLQTEVELLQQISHKNLVQLHGYCIAEDSILLVLEYIDGGSLKTRLRSPNLAPLTWEQRLKILRGSAEGLRYLHAGLDRTIIHRDIKSDNILIDDAHMVPKISDFGVAKQNPNESEETWMFSCTSVIGTFGYIAPEYISTRCGSRMIDVYAFGIVILEVLTGRPPCGDGSSLRVDVEKVYDSGESIYSIADPRLHQNYDEQQFKYLLEIALQCCKTNPRKRLTMIEVSDRVSQLLRNRGVLVLNNNWSDGALKCGIIDTMGSNMHQENGYSTNSRKRLLADIAAIDGDNKDDSDDSDDNDGNAVIDSSNIGRSLAIVEQSKRKEKAAIIASTTTDTAATIIVPYRFSPQIGNVVSKNKKKSFGKVFKTLAKKIIEMLNQFVKQRQPRNGKDAKKGRY